MSDQVIRREIALRAYRHGYVAGVAAAAIGKQARHTVDGETHQHWRRGYEDGRRAVDSSATAYAEEIKRSETSKAR